MLFRNYSRRRSYLGVFLTAGTLLASPVVSAQTKIEAPKIAELSTDRGPAQADEAFTVTVHLKMRDEAGFNRALAALYTPGSPTYHRWMTPQLLAQYAPTAADVQAVKGELAAHGLVVESVASDRLSMRARGSVSGMESAFHTQLHNFEREGKLFHANITTAGLAGPAASLVKSISGLSNFPMKSMVQYPVDPKTHKRLATIPLAQVPVSGLSAHFSNQCFPGPESLALPMLSGAALPLGQFYGNIYKSESLGKAKVCGWTPSQLQSHYGLGPAYSRHIDGSGETIVIVDGPSDASVQTDLRQFSQLMGLPAITSSNFQIIYPDGKPTQFELNYITNWDDEADLDIEWAHAIAPKAKIVLLIAPTQDWSELEYAVQYAQQNHLGNIISNSYGYPEAAWGAHTLDGFEQVLKVAAAQGIAVNFSSGDTGDAYTGSPNAGGTEFPASSPFVTAIGGTSIGLPNGTTKGAEVGWGNNAAVLANGYGVIDPPFIDGFQSGAGGGVSQYNAKPSWQKSLPGSFRQVPDISAVADPYTGAIVVIQGQVGTIGGTSLACPVFSAMWALADEQAGKSLGQAAPLIAKMPSSAIADVVPFSSPTNPAGVIFDASGSTYYSSNTLLAPLDATSSYYSALWFDQNVPGYVVLSFGTDSSLTVTPGWDNVTGWGVPKGWSFISAAAAQK
jgi:subtilase family serine protease